MRGRAERFWVMLVVLGVMGALSGAAQPPQHNQPAKFEQLDIRLQVGELVLFARKTERYTALSLTLGKLFTLTRHTHNLPAQQPASALTTFQLHLSNTLSLVGQRAPNGKLHLFPQGTLTLHQRAPTITLTFTNLNTITFQLTNPDNNVNITVTYTSGSVSGGAPTR